METHGRINLNKADLTILFDLPKGVKFVALNETQHGYSLEVETDGSIDAQGFLQRHLQRMRLKGMTPVPAAPAAAPTSEKKA